MNTYRINYSTKSLEDGGETGCTNITELSEIAARRAFKERYRGDGYSIINAELIAEDVSASKDQERRALAQIQEIVRSLGRESYVDTAFKGVFEIAESNIDNDFAENLYEQLLCSRQRAESAMNQLEVSKEECKKLQQETMTTTEMLAAVREAHRATTENFDATVERASHYAYEIDDLKAEIKHLENEVTMLKARLYDYMIVAA